jgi:tetratricopeptide (TPR) repeat protein
VSRADEGERGHHRVDVARWRTVTRILMTGVAALMAATMARAQDMNRYMECSTNQPVAPELRLQICTEVIAAARIPSHNLAVAFHTRGNDRAIADFDEAIKLDPEFVNPLNDRGLAYFKKGQLDRAIADYDQALKLRRFYLDARLNRALAYQGKGEYDRAIQDYDEAVRDYPNSVAAKSGRAIAYRNKGQPVDPVQSSNPFRPGAIQSNNQPIGLTPAVQPVWPGADTAFSFYNQGSVLLNQKDYDRAIASFDEAIKLDPKYAAAFLNRGTAYRSKGRDDQAIVDFGRAIELSSNSAAAYFGRALAYQDKTVSDFDAYANEGRYEELALRDYDETIRLVPKSGGAFNNRGGILVSLRQYDRAIKDFDEALRLEPNNGLYLKNRGMAFRITGKYAQAIADLRKALTLKIDEPVKKQIESALKELGVPG